MENEFCTPPCERPPRPVVQTPDTVGMGELFRISPEKTPMEEDKTPDVLAERNGEQKINGIKSIKEDGRRSTAPDPVKLPMSQIFRDPPARYMSPTDNLISPISLLLLSKNKKPVGLVPPPSILSSPSKVPEAT